MTDVRQKTGDGRPKCDPNLMAGSTEEGWMTAARSLMPEVMI
jgi:hypothetical protein